MATAIENGCCEETKPTNPKTDVFGKGGRSRGFALSQIENPIPAEVEDAQELKKLFADYNFVPYAGTSGSSGHGLLAWYLMLAKLSATHNACVAKLLTYAVGGKAKVVATVDPDWETGGEAPEVAEAQASAFTEAVKNGVAFEGGVRKFHMNVGRNLKNTGNSFVELSAATSLGTTRCHLRAHRTSNCLFVNTAPGEAKIVAVSPKWTAEYLKKHPPRPVPLFPVYAVDPDGTLRTMFQLKSGDNAWYGRPDSEGSDLYKYREVQDAFYLVRQASANFTGQLIVEVEDDDPNFAPAIEDEKAESAGFGSFADRMERNFTQKSEDPQSVLVTARPFGSRPMFVFQLAPNTNENWYKVTGELAEQKVLRSHGCTLRFMSFDVSNGFSQDAFIADYVMNMEPVVNALRETITDFTNSILTEAWRLLGKEELNQYSITFTEPISSAVAEYRVLNSGAATAQNQAAAA